MFSCLTRDASTQWQVNETAINHLPASLRDDLVMEHVTSGEIGLFLVIPARSGTRVQCE